MIGNAAGDDFHCSAVSRAMGEPLVATAPHMTTWFLLEYPGRWMSRAVKDNDLPEPVKSRLDSYLRFIPQSRLLLIRQRPRLVSGGLRFFVARTHADRQALYEFVLDDYEALLELDLGAIAQGDASYEAYRRARPLFTICMHGRRDRCCPLFGLPVHVEMMQHGGPAVWQSSHIGGHRFAPNVISFPHGLVYGRVSAGRVRALMNDCRDGLVTPDLMRGRSCYEEPIQAADVFLRQATGVREVGGFALQEVAPDAGGAWTISFLATASHMIHRLRVIEEPADFAIYGSCGDDALKETTVFRLIAHEAEPAVAL